ncbi:hypothetical protein AcV7_004416 [Taiwanofungus camphoratus]|nr:hypothetical protein AcV7_004416 [Antrodia cinnamomea]
MLNIVLLVTCICIVVVLTLYLFWWNRIFGYLLGLVFRLSFWKQGESSTWVDIGSIHLSVLTGRILLKDLRYYSSNQTIKIVKGQISWRYWIRKPAEDEDLSHARVVGEDPNQRGHSPLSCRIHMSLHGIEWFMYNRTAAYVNIVSRMKQDELPPTPPPTPPLRTGVEARAPVRKIFSRNSIGRDSSFLRSSVSFVPSIYMKTPNCLRKLLPWLQLQLPNFDLKNFLPISFEATKGAIICGNASTPSLLVAEFHRAEGTYGVVQARSKHDLYKQLSNVNFRNVSVRYVDNTDYNEHMNDTGKKVHDDIRHSRNPPLRQSSYLSFSSFERLWEHLKLWTVTSSSHPSRLRAFFPYPSVPVPHPPTTWSWRKAHKNSGDETPIGEQFLNIEYAVERKILEAPTLELLYYADVVGVVPSDVQQPPLGEGLDPFDIGNGDLPPEWGIDIVVRGGFLRYGPWADRQRVGLQHAFFPQVFHNAECAPRLKPGDMRMWTGLKVFIELRDGVTLHIPFRESSKNWQWDGAVEVPNRPRKREPASIHVRAGDSSTISYIMPMIAGPVGYEPILEVHLDTVTVTSSLNDIRLVTAESCRVRSHLPSPLKWNGERQWTFAVSLRQTSLFLLRDHINMLTDLGKDWSAGPPSDYHRFIPMLYAVDLDMHNYEINAYVNDHNIIDKPLIKEDNALLTLRGTYLNSGARIPFLQYRPEGTSISFWIEAPDIAVSLSLPRWNTYSLYPTPDRSDIGRIGLLHIDSSYRYFAEVREENVDQLKLDFSARDVIYKAFGWTVRHFMILRDNYFGSFTHFSTLFEYLEKRRRKEPIGDPIDLQHRPGKSNSLEVELAVNVDRGSLVLPAGLPGYEVYNPNKTQSSPNGDLGRCVVLRFPNLQVQLRTNGHYMEMSLNVDTLSGGVLENCSNETLYTHSGVAGSFKETLVVDGIDVTANRLFGPQPHASTYVCIWEVHLGDVKACLSAYEGRLLYAAGTSFGLNFSDSLNAPANEYALPPDPDVTFIKFSLDSVSLVWLAGDIAAEVSLSNGLRIDSNDLAGKAYRKVTSLRLPHASFKAFLGSKRSSDIWYEATGLTFDANLDLYSAPAGWEEVAHAQTEFIAAQDKPTGRARCFYSPDHIKIVSDKLLSGRGLIESDIYIPQLRIPGHLKGRQIRDANRNNLERRDAGLPHFLSPSMTFQSESDADEVFSEADRDARLANSRPVSSLTAEWHSDDSENMLSGDESDDGDLTDPRDWDSEHSDESEVPFVENRWPSVLEYRSLIAHYRAELLDQPSMWVGSPFSCVRNTVPVFQQSTNTSVGDNQWMDSEDFPLRNGEAQPSEPDIGTTVFRFLCKKGLDIWLTPLVLPVVEGLLKEINLNQLSPELRFDALMAAYIQSVPSNSDLPRHTIVSDVYLSSIRIRSMQSVPIRDAATSDGKSGLKSKPHLQEHIRTVAELSLDQLHIRTKFAERHPDCARQDGFSCSFKAFEVILKTEERVNEVSSPVFPTVRIALGGSCASHKEKEVVVSLGLFSMESGHTAVQSSLATVVTVLRYIRGLLNAHERLSTYTPALQQQMIYQVLTFSRRRQVVDPLSTIQPSYLVQTGRPGDLRSSSTFKFLVHLRNCLRYLQAQERDAIVEMKPDLQSSISLMEIISTMESQSFNHGVDDDVSSLSQQSFLHELFPANDASLTDKKLAKGGFPVATASLDLKGVLLSVRHPVDNICSTFSLGPVVILVHIHSTGFLQSSPQSFAKSYPNLSLREKERLDIRHLTLSLSLGEITFTIFPHLMRFVQVILRAHRQYCSIPHTENVQSSHTVLPSPPRSRAESASHVFYIEIALSVKSLRFKAAADSLTVQFDVSRVTCASTSLVRSPTDHEVWDFSMNHSLVFGETTLQACSTVDNSKHNEHGILASLIFRNGRINMALLREPHSNSTVQLVLGLDSLHFNVPRSVLRLYRFTQEWRADYLPSIDAGVQALLSELHQEPKKPASLSSHASQRSNIPTIQVQMYLQSLRVTLQVMLGTWLSWSTHQTIISLSSSSDVHRKQAHAFGIQMGLHLVGISPKSHSGSGVPANAQIRLELPAFTLKANYDETGVQGLAVVEFFQITIRPSDWDTILSVQQKSGQDFYDLLHLIDETHQRRPLSTKSVTSQENSLRFIGSLRMRGFRIGLEGLSSTVFLECDDISGGIENNSDLSWQIKLSDLALSLDSRSNIQAILDRGHRSAFVTIDFKADMRSQSAHSHAQHLQIAVTKVHAVLQPTSIGELGDFVDHLQAEVLVRKEDRAHELAEFKEKTKSLMRSFDVKVGESPHAESSWLDHFTILLTIKNIGVAFPLAINRDVPMRRWNKQEDASIRAFLFSIKSLVFGTQRGESGQATMKGFSFQFVSRFKQSVATDFSGDSHQTRNRLLYPEMTAQLRSERSAGSRRICIGADVSGFVLDLDSTMPDYTFSLIDVYRQGKDKMERFTSIIPRSSSNADSTSRMQMPAPEMRYNALPTSNILISLIFASGRVRMHSVKSIPDSQRGRSLSASHDPTSEHSSEIGVEIFDLPVVSVWGEYRATPASRKLTSISYNSEPSVLMFKSTIHSSQNTLRPALLPFLTDLVNHVEGRMRQTSRRDSQMSPIQTQGRLPSATTGGTADHAVDSVSGMKMSLSLRIDQSKLELTCQPDVNVIAGVHWDSGGFVINISPGARRVAFTGSVGGLTIGLKHGFLSEDCVRLDARNLAFSITFAKMESGLEKITSSISVVVDTEFSGGVRFSRLQDVLCFKAVWLDRIPIFSGQNMDMGSKPLQSGNKGKSITTSSQQELTTVLLLRLRRVQLDADLGQSISLIKLNVHDVLVRTKLTDALSEYSLSVAQLAVLASGNVSGQLTVPDFRFRTIRNSEGHSPKVSGDRMLDLTITTGVFNVELESEYQKLIQYWAEPIEIKIFDDWSKVTSQVPTEERRIDVAFTVSGTEVIVIMNVGTIPKLVSYANKFRANLDAQREGASRESKAFRIASSPKPENPLSAVANAMLKSTRSRLKEVDTSISYIIGQRMSLRLDFLQLIVFPRAMRDPELAQFVGRDVHARLDRLVESDALPARRDLHLSFSSITTSRITQLNHALVAKEKIVGSKQWLSTLTKDTPEAIIFGLPSMDIRMLSEEIIQENRRSLQYDFSSKFTIKEGMKGVEDIYITLNMALYSWLTVLRKTFAREMEQVQAATDVRVGPNSLVQQTLSHRKRALESSVLSEEKDTDNLFPGLEPPEQERLQPARTSNSITYSRPKPRTSNPVSPSDGRQASYDAWASPSKSPASPPTPSRLSPPATTNGSGNATSGALSTSFKSGGLVYEPRERHIERLTMKQLGEATPDVMHPFFMKKAGFSLEDSLPQYVHEYATMPTEEIMKALLKLYSKQLSDNQQTETVM